jgi:2,3-bisphosphoglycerate-dependent phosphoglycerate mutase
MAEPSWPVSRLGTGDMELLLVRHALPEMILCADGPADPGLAPEGHRQAAQLAEYLSRQKIDLVVTSPLRRALETVAPTSEVLGLVAGVVDDIAESDRHSRSYVPMEELRRDPRLAAIVERANADVRHEAKAEFRDRVVSAIEQVIVDNPGGRVVVMSHGGVINVYLAHVLGLEREVVFEPRYASVSRLLASRRGHRNVETLNETHYLRAMATSQ